VYDGLDMKNTASKNQLTESIRPHIPHTTKKEGFRGLRGEDEKGAFTRQPLPLKEAADGVKGVLGGGKGNL